MSYLTVNGIEVQCDAGAGSDITPVLIGEDGRAFNGAPFSTERATKGEMSARTLPLPLLDVPAWSGLLKGEGHAWSFDSSTTSSRGLVPSVLGPGYDATVPTIHSSGGKWGGYLDFSEGAYLTYNLGLSTSWTILAWRNLAGTWQHYLLTSAGDDFYNGAPGAPGDPFDWFGISGGVLVLTADNGAFGLDDLVVLPFAVPAAWVMPLYTFNAARAFSQLPRVTLGGDVVTAGLMPSTAMGRPGKAQPVYQGPTATFSFEFTLRGV